MPLACSAVHYMHVSSDPRMHFIDLQDQVACKKVVRRPRWRKDITRSPWPVLPQPPLATACALLPPPPPALLGAARAAVAQGSPRARRPLPRTATWWLDACSVHRVTSETIPSDLCQGKVYYKLHLLLLLNYF